MGGVESGLVLDRRGEAAAIHCRALSSSVARPRLERRGSGRRQAGDCRHPDPAPQACRAHCRRCWRGLPPPPHRPLLEKGRPAWEFQNVADIMRLRPGLNFNITVLELDGTLRELFKHDPEHPEWFKLPQGVVPLCNNSSLSRILAMMPLCDSHGIDATWQGPANDIVQAFFDDLVEVPVNPDEKKGLTRDTTPDELAYIASRMEEAAAAVAAGAFGFTAAEADAAEVASLAERAEFVGEEEPAGRNIESGEPAEDTGGLPETDASSSQLLGSSSQAEPPAPPRRRLRKAGGMVGRQTSQQPQRRVTRSTVATGAGSSRAAASAPAAS